MDFNESLGYLRDMIQALLLPSLKIDLDSEPIEREHFAEYHKNLELQLPTLYDLLQQQKQNITQDDEIISSLIALLSEITAPQTIFQLNSKHLLKNAHRLRRDFRLNERQEHLLFEYYRGKLKADTWKKNLGAVHGLENFLQFYYHNDNEEVTFKSNWLTFTLSVALMIRDCYDNTYKQLGIKMFLLILDCSQKEEIIKLNVHSVVYDSAKKDTHFLDSVNGIENIWNCLYNCLDFFENIDSTNWSQVDDLLENLIRNIPLSSNPAVSICLIGFVTKLSAYFTLGRNEILLKSNAELADEDSLEDCLKCCVSNTSYTIFRWAKSILDMIVSDSYKLMQNVNICLLLLKAFHKCYMVAILPIMVQIAEPHLATFFEKFTAVLMEVIVTHEHHSEIVKQTKLVIETFLWQLNRSSYAEQSMRLSSFRPSFEKLLKHPVFEQSN